MAKSTESDTKMATIDFGSTGTASQSSKTGTGITTSTGVTTITGSTSAIFLSQGANANGIFGKSVIFEAGTLNAEDKSVVKISGGTNISMGNNFNGKIIILPTQVPVVQADATPEPAQAGDAGLGITGETVTTTPEQEVDGSL